MQRVSIYILQNVRNFVLILILEFLETKHRFNPYASSTYKRIAVDPSFIIEYGIGKLSGIRAEETVSVNEISI